MIRISREALQYLPAAIEKPSFDTGSLGRGIVHIGLGGFHRAHMARYTHDLMNEDAAALAWGIVGAGLRLSDKPLLEALAEQDNLYSLTEVEGRTKRRTTIGSLAAVIDASSSTDELLAAIADPRTRIVSMTVTENGYCLDAATKTLDLTHTTIVADLADPTHPQSLPGILVEGYERRRQAGLPAFTALSCDNIHANGNVLADAVDRFAIEREPRLAEWIRANATFPNSMVDRITPVPAEIDIRAFAAESGIDDRAALKAELFRQWVIEDRFVAARPAWERVGAQFVTDVAPYERMKLRLLNASHLAISAMGQLTGYELVSEAVDDPLIRRYMVALMERETGATLQPVPGIDLDTYKQALLARFANKAIKDTVQRVNTDAPVNVLVEPIRDLLAAGKPVDLLALALAAWLRRVAGDDEKGRPLEIVHPLRDLLKQRAMAGGPDPLPLLSINSIFGDLGDDRRFVSVVGSWLGSIYTRGMRETLSKAASDGLLD